MENSCSHVNHQNSERAYRCCISLCLLHLISSALLLLSPSSTYSQEFISRIDETGKVVSGANLQRGIELTIMKGDSILSTYSIDLNEDMKIIVQFDSPPLSVVKARSKVLFQMDLTSARTSIESEQQRFKMDIVQLESQALSQPNTIYSAAMTQIKHEYYTAFNGMALTTKRWMVDEIRNLPYVKNVFEDNKVKALDDESNHVIGADSVWTRLGVTGKEIVIGIVDTGIDYSHPDLGRGFGPGFKVMGGYDFVNNDNDPTDDNGHGTHVAGIAAANGNLLKGVAPDAKLMAFKVLDSGGSGDNSWVIAGIDRALNPDNNPNTDDAVDIINLSLGGFGNPDDPGSQAVDNAVRSGVVCVVAAGNTGSYAQSIDSPGCARNALTVGATDVFDVIAQFSSRGPSKKIFAIKPDVVAPGVQINSANVGGGYVERSGTSMATPHVTGAVALLLELHPDWTPEMIKSALMQSAIDIGEEIMTQGSGRINVYNATLTSSILTPPSLNLGIIDLEQSVWTTIDTLLIHNLSNSPSTYTFSLDGNSPLGVAALFNPSSVTIDPGGITEVLVEFVIDNNLIQNSRQPYIGNLVANSGADNYTIPFSFVKNPSLEITLYGRSFLYFIVRDKQDFQYLSFNWNETVLLDPGIYDIWAVSPETFLVHFIVHEDIEISTTHKLTLRESDAIYSYSIEPRNENGEPIEPKKYITGVQLLHPVSDFGVRLTHVLMDHIPDYRFSPMSSNYRFEWWVISYPNHKPFYTFKGYTEDLSSHQVFTNLPSELKHLTINYNFPEKVQDVMLLQWEGNSATYGFAEYFSRPFVQRAYIMSDPLPEFPTYLPLYNFQEALQSTGPSYFSRLQLYYLIPALKVNYLSDVELHFLFEELEPNLTVKGNSISYGLGPPHWFGKFENTSYRIQFKTNTERGYVWENNANGINQLFFPLFLSQLQDASPKSLEFKLYDSSDTFVQNGNLIDHMETQWPDASVGISLPEAGQYKVEIPDANYSIHGVKGKAVVRATMDTRLTDKNPPSMTSLNILAGGEFTDFVRNAQTGQIQFSVADNDALKEVTLYYHSENDSSWQVLPLTNSNNLYSAVIPSSLPNEFISLQIVAEDVSENILEYTVEPAFLYGTNHAPAAFRLLFPANTDTIQITSPPEPLAFTWESSTDPDQDQLLYTFELNGSGIDTTIASLQDTTVNLHIMPLLQIDSGYSWHVSVTDGFVSIAAQDTFTFHTSSAITGIESSSNIPKTFALYQNYPNPFNPGTTIKLDIPKQSTVSLKIFNVLGQEVRTLIYQGGLAPGIHEIIFDGFDNSGKSLSSGVYVYQMSAGEFTKTKKMLLLRWYEIR